jgi:hypothetical protein
VHWKLWIPLSALTFASCASRLPAATELWEGKTAGVVAVSIRLPAGESPPAGWLHRAEPGESQGFVEFTKWDTSRNRYEANGHFRIEPKWDPNARRLGLLERKGGKLRFCALNPEHGGFSEGSTVVHTYSWDYCAELRRR